MKVYQLDFASSDLLSNIVFLDRYMLGPRMELGVVGECDGALVINIDWGLERVDRA